MSKTYIAHLPERYIEKRPDGEEWLQMPVNVSGHELTINTVIPLTPYTEPDLDAVKKEVHNKCMSEAEDLAYKLYSPKIDEAYQRGLNDAWDVARKIFSMDGEVRETLLHNCFFKDIIENISASEAVKKIRQYEKQEEIKVGNEVDGEGGRGIITKISNDGDHFNIMWENGSTGYYMIEDFKKTGRHFPEIAEVLKKMQEG